MEDHERASSARAAIVLGVSSAPDRGAAVGRAGGQRKRTAASPLRAWGYQRGPSWWAEIDLGQSISGKPYSSRAEMEGPSTDKAAISVPYKKGLNPLVQRTQ